MKPAPPASTVALVFLLELFAAFASSPHPAMAHMSYITVVQGQNVLRSQNEQRKRLLKKLREIDKFTDVDPMFQEGQKEKWKEYLQETEQKRNDLLLEHQRC